MISYHVQSCWLVPGYFVSRQYWLALNADNIPLYRYGRFAIYEKPLGNVTYNNSGTVVIFYYVFCSKHFPRESPFLGQCKTTRSNLCASVNHCLTHNFSSNLPLPRLCLYSLILFYQQGVDLTYFLEIFLDESNLSVYLHFLCLFHPLFQFHFCLCSKKFVVSAPPFCICCILIFLLSIF